MIEDDQKFREQLKKDDTAVLKMQEELRR